MIEHLVLRAFALALLVVASTAHAATDPDRRWFTLTTEHFAIHSHSDADGSGEAFARAVGAYCEEARERVGEALGWFPKERVHVVVVDDFDAANGFAGVVPYPAITIWAHSPPPDSELGHYVDWVRLLVFHEYAHIAHLDQASGLPELFNGIFGRVWKPNNALPRWATEGLAVWVESSLTGRGRVGSALAEMYFRTAALAHRLPALSELTGAPIELPRASSWYLYGGALFDHIAKRSPGAVARFAAKYGEHPLPLALNTLMKASSGKTFLAWYEEVLAAIRERAGPFRGRVEEPGELVRSARELIDAPTFTPDGQLLWVENDGYSATRLVRASLDALVRDQSPEIILRCEGGCGRVRPSRDGREVWLGTGRNHKFAMFYNHLATAPLAAGLARRAPRVLPDSRRAYDPEPAADGKSLWAARTRWGVGELVRFDLATGELVETIAVPGELMTATSWPRFDDPQASADGRSLWVSLHVGGERDLYHVDLKSRRFTRLTGPHTMELDPRLTADQRFLLYSSDRGGIWNVYALELATGRHLQLTDTVTGAFQPTVSPDGGTLVYRRWTADGPELRRLPFRPELAREVEPAQAEPTPGIHSAPPPTPLTRKLERHRYQGLATMLPRSFLPNIVAGNGGLASIGLLFDTVDASGRYALTLSTDWSVSRSDWSAFAQFAWRGGYPDLTLQLGRYTWDRASVVGDLAEDYVEEILYTNASMHLPVPDVFAGLTWGLGFTVDLARGASVGLLSPTPEMDSPFIPREGLGTAMNLYFGVFDTRQHPLDVSPSEGVSGSFNLSLRDPAIGSRASVLTLTFATRAYLPLPGPDGHVFALRLGGGLSGGDPDALSVFSLGGVPRQDLLSDLLNQTAAGAIYLRGFPEGHLFGTRFGLLTGEWRFPLVRARSGVDTLPVFIEDLSVAVFGDLGSASWDADLGEDLRASLGAELRFRLELFYGLLSDFRVGYARGFGPFGVDQFYLLMAPSP